MKNDIGKGGFGTVRLASWLDGPIISWNENHQKWNRNACYSVALKILTNSNESFNLLNEVSCYYYIYYFIFYLHNYSIKGLYFLG